MTLISLPPSILHRYVCTALGVDEYFLESQYFILKFYVHNFSAPCACFLCGNGYQIHRQKQSSKCFCLAEIRIFDKPLLA